MMAKTKIKKPKNKIERKKLVFYQAIGRRKEATARVRLYPISQGTVEIGGFTLKGGQMIVNNLPIEKYFPSKISKVYYLEPFRITNTIGRFNASIKVEGSGKSGQLGAVIHGIARALEKVDKEKFRSILKKRGFLTRDPRAKERRKAGYAQKARAKKQSPKR